MDINDLRSIVTVASFLTFLGIIVWAYGLKSNKKRFEEAANLPFDEDEVDRAELGLSSGNLQGKTS
jgi:cytochrome c oxidase cbb3-type subunit IV